MVLRLRPRSDARRAALEILTVIDEYTRECLAIRVNRTLRSEQVLEVLGELFVQRGVPQYIRSDNGPEFTCTAVREWLSRGGAALDPTGRDGDTPGVVADYLQFHVRLLDVPAILRRRFPTRRGEGEGGEVLHESPDAE